MTAHIAISIVVCHLLIILVIKGRSLVIHPLVIKCLHQLFHLLFSQNFAITYNKIQAAASEIPNFRSRSCI